MRAAIRLLLPFALLAQPALAAGSDVQSDSSELNACVADQKNDPNSCIETVATSCIDQLSSETDEGVNGCYDREAEAWDAILNENYKAARVDAEDYDTDSKSNGGDPEAAASLKTAQKAWIAFRDAECNRLYNRYIDGTIRITIFSACQNRLTAERAIELGRPNEPN